MPTALSSQTSTAHVSKSIYFPGLNAFRFLAAAAVVLVHAEDMASDLPLNAFRLHISQGIGGLAVTFFFVLSGFLITFLLLEEKERYGTVNIKSFYLRRILRIWPLYYLIVFIAFVLLNNPAIFPSIAEPSVYREAPTDLLLYLTMLPQLAWISDIQIIYANQLWSVGVEEQFYLVWPLLMKYLSRRGKIYFMVALIAGFIFTRNGAAFMLSHTSFYPQQLTYFINLLTVTRIDCMAIGGLGAYLYYYHKAVIQRVISSTLVDVLVAGITIALIVLDKFIPYVMYELYSVLFCYIILSASCKEGKRSILQLESPIWNWLGKLSYGIYMWHMIVLGLLLALIRSQATSGMTADILLYGMSLPLTIAVSWFSYKYIETPFLRIKHRFTLIKSRAS